MGLIRLFLAWVVAADHWSVFVLRPHSVFLDDNYKFGFNSGYAVMFFYIVSGFLITYTLTRNYDRNLPGACKFYRNPFIRIFSLDRRIGHSDIFGLRLGVGQVPLGEPPGQADGRFPAGNGLANRVRGLPQDTLRRGDRWSSVRPGPWEPSSRSILSHLC